MGYSFARMEAHPTRTVVRIQTRNQLRASLLCHGGPFTFFIITIITVTRTFFPIILRTFIEIIAVVIFFLIVTITITVTAGIIASTVQALQSTS